MEKIRRVSCWAELNKILLEKKKYPRFLISINNKEEFYKQHKSDLEFYLKKKKKMKY